MVQFVTGMSPAGTVMTTCVKFALGPRFKPVIDSRVPPVVLATVTPGVVKEALAMMGGATLDSGTALACPSTMTYERNNGSEANGHGK